MIQRELKITFKADPRYFSRHALPLCPRPLAKRLQELAFLNAAVLRIRILDRRSSEQDEFCYPEGIVEFVR